MAGPPLGEVFRVHRGSENLAVADAPRRHASLMVHEQGMEFWQICRFDDPVAVLRILLEAVIHAGHPGGDGKTDPPLLKETAEVIEEFERRAHAS